MAFNFGGKVVTLVQEHTCGWFFDNKNASSKWVAKVLINNFRSCNKVTLPEIVDDTRKQYTIGITRSQAIATKILPWKRLKKMLLNNTHCFRAIMIMLNRPDPTLPPRFRSYYICLDACKKGFVEGCRPFIGVDGCHLKTKYGDQMLIVVGRDANDQYFPLAFVVVETKTKESWIWFLTLLLENIGFLENYRTHQYQPRGME
ncbi:hypothetical protein CR513_04098, partial [Mucuna pruriens]